MTREDLQHIFESEFNWDNWKKVMNFVFPEFKFNLIQTDLARDTKTHKQTAGFIKEHGSGTLTDQVMLTLCEILVTDSVRLDRNIKTVRSLVSDLSIPNFQTIIAVFHNADKTKWRFTLVVRELSADNRIVDKKPDSYTYVFGVNEKGRTASERFFKLAGNPKKTLKDLEEAFSVEALSKKFFKEYKESYQKFVDDIINNPHRLALFPENTEEKQKKCARDFVKKMMGRLVFLYFLQKKGWLGCKTKWQGGDEVFMKTFVEKATKDNNFYFQFLEPLFFDTLNEKRTKHDEDCIISKINFGKVPYLNGGLFEKDDNHPAALTITWDIFKTFFDTLNNYNFTIIEDDPEFKEVAVDPEMLGHIFENLLEDNKDKGAFYTPKEIVHYMCQESLYEYLKTYLQQNSHWPQDESDQQQLEKSLQRFVKQKLASGVIDFDKPLAKALKDVKICDPSIGSGAFPMGLLNEIYNCVHKLHDESPDKVGDVWGIGKEWQGNKVKLNIIQNSIYGVDIEKGAVDIARLRFWLSLIVDEPEPTPLPNLEYKIVVGNSLVSKLGNDVIDIDWNVNDTSHGLFGAELADKKKNILREISAEQKESFSPDSDKHTLAIDIRKLKIDLLITQLELMIKLANQDEQPKSTSFKDKRAFAKASANFMKVQGWKAQIKHLEALKKKKNDRLDFFDWTLDFPEIMNDQLTDKPGFDIVIGNPPYFVYEKAHHEEIESILIHPRYEIAKSGKLNAYKVFLALCPKLQKSQTGVICLIFQNSFLGDTAAKLLRKYFLENQTILRIDSFPERDNHKKRVFESAKMSVCIFFSVDKKPNFSAGFELVVWDDILTTKRSTCRLSKEEINLFDPESLQFPMIDENEKPIFLKFHDSKANRKLSTAVKTYRGELNMTTERRFFTLTPNDYMAMKGAQIQRFFISESMSQGTVEYVLRDKYLLETKGVRAKHHEVKRIVTQRITGVNEKIRLKATILNENRFCADSCNYLIPVDEYYTVYLILGFINSSLFNWIFKKTSTNSNVNGYELDSLTLPNEISHATKERIESIVHDILIKKQLKENTQSFEKELDAIIYKLYKLTIDEVRLVAPQNSIGQEYYDSLLV